MSERIVGRVVDGKAGYTKDVHQCDTCKNLSKFTPATHSTKDAVQVDAGWQKTAPRYGCAQHEVLPFVILTDGTRIPFAEYQRPN
jgi:hypothetical protein